MKKLLFTLINMLGVMMGLFNMCAEETNASLTNSLPIIKNSNDMSSNVSIAYDPCWNGKNSSENNQIEDKVVGGLVDDSSEAIQYHAWEAGHRTGKSVFGMYYFDDYYSKYQKADHRSTGGIEITNIGKCPGGAGYVMGWHPGMNYWNVKDKYPNVEILGWSSIPQDPNYSHYLNTDKQYRAGYEQKEFKYLKAYNDCY